MSAHRRGRCAPRSWKSCHEDFFGQARRRREEVDHDRRDRPRRRSSRDPRGHAAARKAQADLHPACRRRRQCHHRQRGKDRADRQEAREQGLSPSHRLYRRHQGAHGALDPGRQVSPADRGEGDRAHAAQGAARAGATRQPASLCRSRTSACRAEPRETRRWCHEPQEQEERVTMAETMQSLDQLSTLKPAAAPETPKYIQKLDMQGGSYATGKRKDAVARVWVKPGAGKIVVNTRDLDIYFARPVLRMLIQQPLVATNRNGQYDVICTVSGGGLSGQAGAVRHGLSKALMNFEPDLRGALKRGGFLTRDSRVVERKKYGRAKARRSFQFSKR